MVSLDDFGEPTDAERRLADTVTRAIQSSDRLGILPFIDKESEERVMFLVAIQEHDEDHDTELSIHPIGPLYDLEETMTQFELPDDFSD